MIIMIVMTNEYLIPISNVIKIILHVVVIIYKL